jgi:Mrp family chromosome partitioning ATPase
MSSPGHESLAGPPRNEIVGAARARITEMGEIPRMLPAELDRLRIVHPLMPDAAVMRAFEQLLGKLLERAQGSNFVVGVAAMAPAAGGSFVSVNLAASIALDHHRTALLIDGDSGNPVTQRLLMMPPETGLADYCADPALDIERIIHSSRIPRLRIIPGGPLPAGPQLLVADGMAQLLRSVRARYSDRYVVVDIPAALPIESTHLLAQWCDFIVLVVPYGRISVSQLRAAADSIGGDKLAGAVINRDPAP